MDKVFFFKLTLQYRNLSPSHHSSCPHLRFHHFHHSQVSKTHINISKTLFLDSSKKRAENSLTATPVHSVTVHKACHHISSASSACLSLLTSLKSYLTPTHSIRSSNPLLFPSLKSPDPSVLRLPSFGKPFLSFSKTVQAFPYLNPNSTCSLTAFLPTQF